ncbi:hypothetical protein DENIT_11066 [Pseudomonas veronii]|jgi:hypothetical protein|nr:hypothetical protein DENIT_11066 [Pseudomonas veronii]
MASTLHEGVAGAASRIPLKVYPDRGGLSQIDAERSRKNHN